MQGTAGDLSRGCVSRFTQRSSNYRPLAAGDSPLRESPGRGAGAV